MELRRRINRGYACIENDPTLQVYLHNRSGAGRSVCPSNKSWSALFWCRVLPVPFQRRINPSTMSPKISVLFVCLGNICRSTMGEGVFRSLTKNESSPYYDVIGEVDSCGTGMRLTHPESVLMTDHGMNVLKQAATTLAIPPTIELAIRSRNMASQTTTTKRAR